MKRIPVAHIFLIAFIAFGCRSNTPVQPASTGTLAVYIFTPVGGPAIGPLAGAPVKIERIDSSVVTTETSDSTGWIHIRLDQGSYILDPQPVPSNPTFYTPPEKSVIRVTAGITTLDSLYYANPIIVTKGTGIPQPH